MHSVSAAGFASKTTWKNQIYVYVTRCKRESAKQTLRRRVGGALYRPGASCFTTGSTQAT